MNTPQKFDNLKRAFSAQGYEAVRLAPTLFQFDYGGHLLMPNFGLLRVDYKA